MTAAMQTETPIRPTASEASGLRAFVNVLDEIRRTGAEMQTTRLIGPDGTEVEFPASLFEALVRLAHEMVQGNAVQVVPVHAELTTQQAADLLGVSRPHVVKLLEHGELPFGKVGTHRRIRFDDLMEFRAKREAERADALRRLTRSAEDLGIRY